MISQLLFWRACVFNFQTLKCASDNSARPLIRTSQAKRREIVKATLDSFSDGSANAALPSSSAVGRASLKPVVTGSVDCPSSESSESESGSKLRRESERLALRAVVAKILP